MDVQEKKKLEIDLWIIFVISMLVMGIYMVFNKQINSIAYNPNINIVLRVMFMGILFQFGLAGLGITVVSIIRKESFISYGLTKKNLLLTIGLTILCCLPDFVYNFFAGNVHAWFPFSDVNLTKQVVASGFPANVFGMLIIALCWGFFEGFNYVCYCRKNKSKVSFKIQILGLGCFCLCCYVYFNTRCNWSYTRCNF